MTDNNGVFIPVCCGKSSFYLLFFDRVICIRKIWNDYRMPQRFKIFAIPMITWAIGLAFITMQIEISIFFAKVESKVYFGTLALAYPIPLRFFYMLLPFRQKLQIFEHSISVFGDLQYPLSHGAFFYYRAASLA